MSRKPNYEELYKVCITILRSENVCIDFDSISASSISNEIDCNKSTVYSYIQKIQQDLNFGISDIKML